MKQGFYYLILIIFVFFMQSYLSTKQVHASTFSPRPYKLCTGIEFTQEEQIQLIKGGNKLRQYLIDTGMTKNHLLIPAIKKLQEKTNSAKKRCQLEILSDATSIPVRFGKVFLNNETPTITVDFLSVIESLENSPANNMPLENKSLTKRVYHLRKDAKISVPAYTDDHQETDISINDRSAYDCGEKRSLMANMCPREWTSINLSALYLVNFNHGEITNIYFVYQE